MDDPWDDAIKEAYANAPGEPVLATLELRHSSWTAPVRVARDTIPLNGLLEADAPEDAGTVVEFTACAFDAVPPESTENLPEVKIKIDNVTRVISGYLVDAMGVRQPVGITYREYLASDAESAGPHYVLDGLTLRRATCTTRTVTGTAVFGDFLRRMFPNKFYEADDYEGLVR